MSCPRGRKTLFHYAVPYWRRLTLVLLLSLLSTGLSLVLPYLSKDLVDRALLGRNSQALLQVLALFVGITLLSFALNMVSGLRYTRHSPPMRALIIHNLSFTVCETAEAAVRDAQAQGYQVIGIELADTAVPLHEVETTDKVCLALGHEDRGLSAATLALCDDVAFIPMLGKIGSLNVATAAAIACYEVRRHSWTSPAPPSGPAAARSHAVGIDLDA